MSRFLTGVSDWVKVECRMAMLHNYMNISRLVVSEQSIKESKMTRVRKDLKRGRYEDQGQPRFKNRALNQDLSSTPKFNQEGGGGSPIAKPTCSTCGKKHFGKCLSGTSGMNARQAPYSGPSVDGQAMNRFYALQANKEANPDEGAGSPEEDPNPWPSKLPMQLEVVIGGSGSASRTCSIDSIHVSSTTFKDKDEALKTPRRPITRSQTKEFNDKLNGLPSLIQRCLIGEEELKPKGEKLSKCYNYLVAQIQAQDEEF
uniref:Gag-pol polyprotein n=1 Tax=Solanum tuberosum TaxID=4113 RepID=M1DKT2_SOLTU